MYNPHILPFNPIKTEEEKLTCSKCQGSRQNGIYGTLCEDCWVRSTFGRVARGRIARRENKMPEK